MTEPDPTPGAPRPRVTAQMRSLRFDAGSLSLDLAATLGRRGGDPPVERMDGPERLRAWCEGVGVALRADASGDAQLAELLPELLALREAVYDIGSAHLRGAAPARQSVALVNAYARAEPPVGRLELAGGAVVVRQPALTGEQLRALVARDLVALLADPVRRAGLRRCEGPLCRMLYLDATPGRRRLWCSMRRCGNSAKAARHRTRVIAQDGSATPAAAPGR